MSDVTTGLTADPVLDGEPPYLQISWIAWNSGFRGSGLACGDRIVAVNGEALSPPSDPRALSVWRSRCIGQYDEAQRWSAAGIGPGSSVTLTVRRRSRPVGWSTLTFTGTLRGQESYRSADNDALMSPVGPSRLRSDEAYSGWGRWYEYEIQPAFTRVLSDSWYQPSFNNRIELRDHLERRERVEFLSKRYPGAFAESVKADYDAALACLQGERIELGAHALEYRRAEEERVDQVRKEAQSAWATFQARIADRTLQPFPATHPIHGDRDKVRDRFVILPPLRNSDWVGEAGHTWFVAGNEQDGWYFADAESPLAGMVLDALGRYRRSVAPNIKETYTLVGRITGDPRLVKIGKEVHFGLLLELVAAFIGDSLFVDLSQAQGRIARFAGEAAFLQPQGQLPPDSASPAEVMQAALTALKEGDQPLWDSLFASWYVRRLPDGSPFIEPYADRRQDADWELSRRSILGKVFDVRVAWTGEPRVLCDGTAYPGAPRVEEVEVLLDHVGQFDGEYRVFMDVSVRRRWALQRRNRGPWRISSFQSI